MLVKISKFILFGERLLESKGPITTVLLTQYINSGKRKCEVDDMAISTENINIDVILLNLSFSGSNK